MQSAVWAEDKGHLKQRRNRSVNLFFKYHVDLCIKYKTHIFTINPEENVVLYVSGFCARDCNDYIMKGHITDRLDLLICEQTAR